MAAESYLTTEAFKLLRKNASLLKFGSRISPATALAANSANSAKAVEKRKITFANRQHQKGSNNSQFDACWVTDGVKPVKIKKQQLDEYLNDGYSRGRRIAKV